MPQDYNFWVRIVTNDHDSVLYIGMTNDLARRISEDRTGEIPGFTANYRCRKLVYYEHCTNAGCNGTRKAAQEMVAIEESGVDRNNEPALARSRARSSRRIVRDVSTSLDMTERALKGAAILWSARSLPSLSFRAKSRNL
jgi:predicted GIY-YIG superfamily endonuclease